MQPPTPAVPNEPKLNPKGARTLVNMPEIGEDGLPLIEEDDIDEQFVRGSGPGGQKINKTASCVVRFGDNVCENIALLSFRIADMDSFVSLS